MSTFRRNVGGSFVRFFRLKPLSETYRRVTDFLEFNQDESAPVTQKGSPSRLSLKEHYDLTEAASRSTSSSRGQKRNCRHV